MKKKLAGGRRRGVCATCGCTHTTPCIRGTPAGYLACAWTDRTQTLCTFCRPAGKKAKKR